MLSRIKDVMFPATTLEDSSIAAILDRNGAFYYVNPQFCSISKYAPDELIGRTYESLVSDAKLLDTIRKYIRPDSGRRGIG